MTLESVVERRSILERTVNRERQLLAAYKAVERDLKGESGEPSFSERVRAIVLEMKEPFTVHDVRKHLGENVTAQRVSFILSPMARVGDLKVLKQGFANTPTIYEPPNLTL